MRRDLAAILRALSGIISRGDEPHEIWMLSNAEFRPLLARAAELLEHPADRHVLQQAEAVHGLALDRLEPAARQRVSHAVARAAQERAAELPEDDSLRGHLRELLALLETTDARTDIAQLSERLGVQHTEQDWGIINATGTRLEEFMAVYREADLSGFQRVAMAELVLASANDRLEAEPHAELQGLRELFAQIEHDADWALPYWRSLQGGEFPLGAWLRGAHAELSEDLVPFREAVRTWAAISLQTFGGPAGQIAVMQRVLVDEKRWLGQRRFLHALNYCMLLPGPEAQQLAIYTGWLLNGVRGGLAAGILFVLPGLIALLALSAVYVAYGDTTAVAALSAGLAPAVLAIVAHAVVRISGRALAHPALVAVAVGAFLALAVFGLPFPAVIAVAGVLGLWLGRLAPQALHATAGEDDDGPPPVIPDDALHAERPTAARAGKVLAVGLVLWALPLLAVAVLAGAGSVFMDLGLFFSGTALVTFGGAYAVLAFVAQRAVEVYGWLAPGEMVRGLALAETTPGPLIMVVQFVAFLGAYRDPGGLDPWVAATLGALLTTWVTFVPCFLFIFLGAPYVERLRGNRRLAAALTGITAAVVGVIANLALYFALHTLFGATTRETWGPVDVELPALGTLRVVPLLIGLAAAVMIFRLRWSVLRTLGVCALLGLAEGLLRA